MKKTTTTAKKSPAKKLVAKKTGVKKYEEGGKKGNKPTKDYYEEDLAGKQWTTEVGRGDYKKTISRSGNSTSKPYIMTVKKDGRTSTFQLSEEQAKKQREIAKKEAGYKKGGTHKAKPKAKKK